MFSIRCQMFSIRCMYFVYYFISNTRLCGSSTTLRLKMRIVSTLEMLFIYPNTHWIFLSSITGDSGECEKVQELPGDSDQACVQRQPVPWHGHQRQGPCALPAREWFSSVLVLYLCIYVEDKPNMMHVSEANIIALKVRCTRLSNTICGMFF